MPWYRRSLALAMAGGLLLWASFPPLSLWPLAWVATVFWIVLIRADRVTGKRFYATLWFAGFAYWMVLFQFIRLPHWSTYIGWAALSAYLGIYLPLFVGLSRIGVRRFRAPVIVVAPVVWVGLELMRGHLFSGLSMALLGHTQVDLPVLIQIADLFGAYAVSFVLMLSAACIARCLPINQPGWTLWPVLPLAAVIAVTVSYGIFRLQETIPGESAQPARVLLIQGSVDTLFGIPPAEVRRREEISFTQYCELTRQARREHPDADLVVWPESEFPLDDVVHDERKLAAADEATQKRIREYQDNFALHILAAKGYDRKSRDGDVDFIAGTLSYDMTDESGPYNAAVLINREGAVANRYYKMHRTPFGEYIVFDEWFPWLYRVLPLPNALTPGRQPTVFEVGELKFAPTICFESTVPHHIRSQIVELTKRGESPDVLLNITDDGWFLGSTCLDHHFACGVFRTVENRRPMLVAANTGFSGWIDGCGRVIEKGPRRDTGYIFAEVTRDGRTSLYTKTGDIFAGLCLLVCGVFAVSGTGSIIARRIRKRRQSPANA